MSSNRISGAVAAHPTIRAIQVPFDTTRPLNLTSHIHGGRLHKTRGHGAHLALPVDRLRGSRFDQPRRGAFNLDLWLDRDHLVVFPRRVGFLFLCMILVNTLLKQHIPAWALNSAELMTVLAMSLVIIGIPVFLTGYFLAIPTTPTISPPPKTSGANSLSRTCPPGYCPPTTGWP